MFGDAFKALMTYEDDKIHGRPFYQDRTLIALVISFICGLVLKISGIHVSADVQGALVVLIVGIAQLSQSHVGVVKSPVQKQVFTVTSGPASAVVTPGVIVSQEDNPKPEEHNLGNLS
jgi:hypothetical protein